MFQFQIRIQFIYTHYHGGDKMNAYSLAIIAWHVKLNKEVYTFLWIFGLQVVCLREIIRITRYYLESLQTKPKN